MSSTSPPFDTPVATGEFDTQLTGEKPDLTSTLFSFQGRVPRSTYWCFSLATGVSYICIMLILSAALGTESGLAAMISLLLYVPLAWITLALQIKRWHDRDKSGWWCLIGMVPLIGPLWAFIEAGCLPGTNGPNSYGNDPLATL